MAFIHRSNWILGPAILILTTLAYEYFRGRGAPPSVIVLLPLLVLAGFLGGHRNWPEGGLWAGLTSAAWIAGYSLYLGTGIERQILVPVGVFVIAILVGFLRLRAWQGEQLEHEAGELALSANVYRLEEIERLARELEKNWYELTDPERKERARWIWARANGIITLAEGWRQVGRHQYWAKRGSNE